MKKKVLCGLAALMLGGLLGACGSGENTTNSGKGGSSEDITLKMWVGTNQAKGYREVTDKFTKETGIKVEVNEVDEADDALLKDAEAAADLMRLPHDQLGQLVEAGTVYENEKYGGEIQEESIPMALDAATYKGKTYGYPASADAMFLFYDKRVFSEEDLATLDGILAKGKVGLNIAEAGADYRLTPWFIANGAELYGKDGEDVNGTTLNNKQGLHVLQWIGKAKSNENIVAVNNDEISALKEGKIQALFSGVWNTANVKEILGDNMGTVVYPKHDFGDGQVNLKAFSGVPIFVVNSATQHPSEAMDLAKYVTSEESQVALFQSINTIPANKKALANDVVQNDPVAATVSQVTTDEHSVLMPSLPEMKNFWPNMNAILVDAYQGKLAESEMQAKLDKLVQDVSKPVE